MKRQQALGVGLLWVAIDRRKQGWHDKIASTVVVRERTGATPARFEHEHRHSSSRDDGRWQA